MARRARCAKDHAVGTELDAPGKKTPQAPAVDKLWQF